MKKASVPCVFREKNVSGQCMEERYLSVTLHFLQIKKMSSIFKEQLCIFWRHYCMADTIYSNFTEIIGIIHVFHALTFALARGSF